MTPKEKKGTHKRKHEQTEWQCHFLSCSSQLKILSKNICCIKLVRSWYGRSWVCYYSRFWAELGNNNSNKRCRLWPHHIYWILNSSPVNFSCTVSSNIWWLGARVSRGPRWPPPRAPPGSASHPHALCRGLVTREESLTEDPNHPDLASSLYPWHSHSSPSKPSNCCPSHLPSSD